MVNLHLLHRELLLAQWLLIGSISIKTSQYESLNKNPSIKTPQSASLISLRCCFSRLQAINLSRSNLFKIDHSTMIAKALSHSIRSSATCCQQVECRSTIQESKMITTLIRVSCNLLIIRRLSKRLIRRFTKRLTKFVRVFDCLLPKNDDFFEPERSSMSARCQLDGRSMSRGQ